MRHYESEGQVEKHLEKEEPSSVGLIKPLALWYELPHLANQEFFVFGESHAAVTGSMIKKASHLTQPILDESHTGWNVSDAPALTPLTANQGLDENSAKLFRALEAWSPKTPGTASEASASTSSASSASQLPDIPSGEESTRETVLGSHRLVVRGDDGASKLWTPGAAPAPGIKEYDVQTPAYNAIKELFTQVFKQEIATKNLDGFEEKLGTAWNYFNDLFNPDGMFFNPLTDRPLDNWLTIATNVKEIISKATRRKVEANYARLRTGPPDASATYRDPTALDTNSPDGPVKPDAYRDEFMLAKALEASTSKLFAFANMGNDHLQRLEPRLKARGITYVTKEQFFGQHSKVAVELPSAKLDEKIKTFLTQPSPLSEEQRKEGNTLLTELNAKGYPAVSPLRGELATRLSPTSS